MNPRMRLLWLVLFLFIFARPAPAQDFLDTVFTGDLAAVQERLAADPSALDELDDNEASALHYAAYIGHLEMTRFFLAQGLAVDLRDLDGFTPLHFAAFRGHAAVMTELLDRGLPVDSLNHEGNTALHYAAGSGHLDAVKLLLDRGADVNRVDHYYLTPLEFAFDGEHEAVVKVLADAGGQPMLLPPADVRQLSPRVYRVLFPTGRASNIALYAGPESALLVDSGFSARAMAPLQDLIDTLGHGKLAYLINTHLHPDHIAGNAVAGKGTTVINHAGLDSLATAGVLTKVETPLTGRTGLQFDLHYRLRFAGEEIRLIPYPGIHTEDDVIVHFTAAGVVHMGDLLISESFPSVQRGTDQYLDLLARVTDVFPADTQFICGHGRECSAEDIDRYRDMLTGAAEIVQTYIDAGKSGRDLRRDGALDHLAEWCDFIPQLNTNYWLRAVYATHAAKTAGE